MRQTVGQGVGSPAPPNALAAPCEPSRQWLLAPRAAWQLRAGVICVVAGTILLHLAVMGTSTGARFDIGSFQLQAATVFHGQNVYVAPALQGRYPYPPVWLWIAAAMQQLSWWLHLPFVWTARLPALAGDVGICILLSVYMRQRQRPSWAALIPTLLYALNPLVLLISAGHGQFDALVVCFVVLALVLRGPEAEPTRRQIVWSALALGMAIALKGYPVLALPYFVLTAPRGMRVLTGLLAFVPLAAAVFVYSALFGFSTGMVTRVLTYRSTFDFGWTGLQVAPVARFAVQPWVTWLLEALLVAFAAVIPALLFRRQPAAAIASIFLFFYATTPTMSVQYLIWVVPFLCLALPLGAVLYSLVAAFGALILYHLLPSAIPTKHLRVLSTHLWPLRGASVAAILVVSALLGAYLIVPRLRSQPVVAETTPPDGRSSRAESRI